MNRKSACPPVVFLLIALCFAWTAYGQDSLIGVDVPLGYNFKTAGDGSRLKLDGRPQGQRIYYANAELGEFGFADFKLPLQYAQNSVMHVRWLDYALSFTLPFDLLFGIGGGLGKAQVEGGSAAFFSSSTAGEYHLSLGYTFFENLHLRYSQHQVIASIQRSDNKYLAASGLLTSFGAALVF